MKHYKKMAGTAAVFILSEHNIASPVERDGLVWSADELKLKNTKNHDGIKRDSMANALALEGLEDYDPPTDGDIRSVDSLNATFVYIAESRAWVQV